MAQQVDDSAKSVQAPMRRLQTWAEFLQSRNANASANALPAFVARDE
jgi:hypothetical protein